MPKNQIDNLLSIAKEAVLLSGKFLAEGDQSIRKVNKDKIRDIKIEADIQSERIIIDYLKGKSDFSILSEEKGLIKGNDEEFLWIVDPLDGSLNYLQRIPLCCTSVGLWKGEKPILGAIFDFNRNELFSGIAGKGAWLNDKPINVSKTDTKQKAILCSGFPIKTDFSTDSLNILIENIQTFRKVRLLGTAALSIAYVAAGRIDAYCEKDIMLWDVAAGVPIVLGSGGQTKIEKTSKHNCINVCVSNGLI